MGNSFNSVHNTLNFNSSFVSSRTLSGIKRLYFYCVVWHSVAIWVSFILKKSLVSDLWQLYLCLKLSSFCINDKIITLIFLTAFLFTKHLWIMNSCNGYGRNKKWFFWLNMSNIWNIWRRQMSSSGNVCFFSCV